jgi:Beta-lactamase enzyme family/ORF 12 gene product N-terminal
MLSRSRGLFRRPGRPAVFVPLIAIAVAASAPGCGGSAPTPAHTAPAHTATPATSASASGAAVSLPDTPAGRQARWLVAAVGGEPIGAAQIRAHFDTAFLDQVPPAKLDAALAGVRSLQIDSVTGNEPDALRFVVTANGTSRLNVSIAVDTAGLINGLLLQPAASASAVPSTWSGFGQEVRSVAPDVRFLVAAVTGGGCVPVQAAGADTPAPLGSAFKLYVLDALARAIAAGRVSWDQPLTVTSQLKSLPSGVLQNQPDGSKVTVQQAATDLISVSDNTAADMLISLLGRAAVESAARATGMARPALDVPFLTPRELFVLKLDDWPVLAGRYLALGAGGRQAMLDGTVARVPLSSLNASGWTAPRDISSLEWFASPADICRVYASLAALARQPGLRPLSAILSLNQGGLSLDPAQWRPAWFKGGSEPGVLTLNYLATTRAGRTYVVSVLAQNPAAPIPASATLTLVSAVTGAFNLLAATS